MDWLTTDQGDWKVVNNEVPLIDGAAETKQVIREHLRTFQGEYFLDTNIGVPYFQTIMQKGVAQATIEAILRDEILSCVGVLGFLDFRLSIDAKTRLATLKFTVLSDDGPITIEEVL